MHRMIRQRRGTALLTAILMMVMLCMLAAVTIDLGFVYGSKSRMQSAADAAALAAVMRIGNDNTAESREEAQAWAIGFANHNLIGMGDVLVPDDVVFGAWDPATETFTEGVATPNAVQVQVRRDGVNADSVGGFFMSIFGMSEIPVTTSATATISNASAAEGMPMALRAPDFGSVDPDVSKNNPGKDGPSSPQNGVSFEPGDSVVVAIYGKGSQPPVHLTLDIDAEGAGAAEADVKKILKGKTDLVEMQVGDEAYVFNEGTGSASYGEALDDRLNLAADDSGRDIVMPVVGTIAGSRDGDDQLTGKVRIADFVSVHLDETVDVDVVDPDNPTKTIKVKYLMGTITNRRAETSWGGATPSGAGGGSVSIPELVK